MARPIKQRCVSADPAATVYKPRGIPLRYLEEQVLGWDELEAIRLADLEGLYHDEAAMSMRISRATFGRVLASAHKKIADALISGKSIVFRGGCIATFDERILKCGTCEKTIEAPFGEDPVNCPFCASGRLYRQKCQHEDLDKFESCVRRRKVPHEK